MLRNYVLIAWRNLKRHKLYSIINLAGLSAGMAVSILILSFVAHEFSFDHFHARAGQLYRPLARLHYGGQTVQMINMSAQFGPAVRQASADVLDYVRIRQPRRIVVRSGPRHRAFEEKFIFADGSLFTAFSFRLTSGNPRQALARPGVVVITERIAAKYFGGADPVGKTLVYDGKHTFLVTGVAQNPPSNSTIDFDFVGSFPSLAAVERTENHFGEVPYEETSIGTGSYLTYFLLRPGADVAKTEKLITRVAEAGFTEKKNSTQYQLLPLLGTRTGHGDEDVSEKRYVYIFLGIGLAILVLALINYMNLATARATQRAKEVGVRKTMGARRPELAAQFYGESLLTCVLAFGLSLTEVQLLRPAFYRLLGLRIDVSFLYSPVFLSILLGLLLFCALVAGSYPALLLSRLAPVDVLKGRPGNLRSGAGVRRVLSVFQFAVSSGLIVCSLIVQQQLELLRNTKLGLQKEQVLVLPFDASLARHYNAFKNSIRQQAGVVSVAAASSPLYKQGTNMLFTKSPATNEDVTINFMTVDASFFRTLGIAWKMSPLDQGRLGTRNTLVLNETAVKKLKLTGNPLGQKLSVGQEDEIIGVVDDFHFTSLRQKIDALMLTVVPDTLSAVTTYSGCLYVRLDPRADVTGSVAAIGWLYRKLRTEKPFEYFFLDEAFNAMYQAEDRLAGMFAAFTGVAVFIACLGLFGLVTFVTLSRTKEIGIRKVLGASVHSLIFLLSKDFFVLLGVAFLLATPVAWYAMHRWLEGYAYRITPQVVVFVAAGLILWLVAWLTILFQTFRAARANPVHSLRYE